MRIFIGDGKIEGKLALRMNMIPALFKFCGKFMYVPSKSLTDRSLPIEHVLPILCRMPP